MGTRQPTPGRQRALLKSMRRSEPNDVVPTPRWLFDELHREFAFTLDVCATVENAKCAKFITADMNGLIASWAGEVCWCNPPYSDIGPWTERAYLEAAADHATSVLLLPAWTDRRWFHTWGLRATEIRFIEGRVAFPGYLRNGNPYPYLLLIFRRGAVAP